jgi:DNA repair exonuclease SbcCD ATPase subunit
MHEFASLPAELARVDQLLSDLHARRDVLSGELSRLGYREADLDALLTQATDARRAKESIASYAATAREIAINESQLADANAELDRIIASPIPAPRLSLAELRREEAVSIAAVEKAKAAREATARVEPLKARRDSLAAELTTVAASVASIDLSNLATLRDSLSTASREREAKEKSLESIREQLSLDEREGARIEARLEALDRRRRESEEKREEAKALDLRGQRLRKLQLAFGPKGAQPLLIDAAAPAIESIANATLATLCGGRLSVRIATQRTLSNGAKAEDFAIRYRRGIHEMDASMGSGGERAVMRLAFRLALMRWLAGRNGRTVDTLFFDEPFDGLDALNADAALAAMQASDSTIILNSHGSFVVERIPTVINVRMTALGTSEVAA